MPTLKEQLTKLFAHDVDFISQRDAHYESSWKREGGQGAYFTIARPWDRFRAIARRGIPDDAPGHPEPAAPWDIFAIIKSEQARGLGPDDDGTIQACIRDLRAYMALLACEAMTFRQNPYTANEPLS